MLYESTYGSHSRRNIVVPNRPYRSDKTTLTDTKRNTFTPFSEKLCKGYYKQPMHIKIFTVFQ